jgi:ABC-type phosphate transport system substrate-binding protein
MLFHIASRAALAATVSAGALLAAGPASAQITTLYGGGSTLAASTYAQLFKSLDNVNGTTTCGGTFQPTGTVDTVCNSYGYIGSGTGVAALIADSSAANNTCSPVSTSPKFACPAGGQTTPADVEYGTYPNPSGIPAAFNVVAYAASDSSLSSAQIGYWNNGSGTQSGVTFHAAQKPIAGPLEQIPTFGTPITIPYKFNGAVNVLGGIQLTEAQLCGVFSGTITTTNDPHLTGTAGDSTNYPNAYLGKTVPASTITVVYRSDNSGTTYLFTQHLAAVCQNLGVPAANVPVTFTATQSFAGVFGANGNPALPANFVGESGSAGVEGKINSTTYSIGYLSPDYTKIAPRNASGAFPVVASLLNRHAVSSGYVTPNTANTTAALATADLSHIDVTNPTTWSPPAADPTAGYPIVGFTNVIFPQCFASNDVASNLYTFLQAFQTGSGNGPLFAQGGFVPVPAGLATFINANILNNSSANVDLQNASLCQAAGGSTYAGR